MLSRLLNTTTKPTKHIKNIKVNRHFSSTQKLSENEFLNLWDEFQQEFIEKLENEEYGQFEDYEDNAETVTIESLSGTVMVLSRHSGNKEIWLSSPISGPSHFRYENGEWLNKHDRELRELLIEDFEKF